MDEPPAARRQHPAARRRPPATRRRPRPAVVRSTLPLSVDDAWALLTDLRNHERWIPLTRITAPWPLSVGDRIEAVSGPAAVPALGLPDRMVVESVVEPGEPPTAGRREARPGRPGRMVFRKVGPVLLGTAEIHVRATGARLSEVAWVERVHLRGLPPTLTAPLLRPLLALMLRLALHRIAVEVADRPR